jgi:Uma2 family endonuclease
VNAKIAVYLSSGVKVVWLIDPEEKQVTVYRPAHAFEIFPESAELTGGDDLPGFICSVARIFRLSGDTSPSPS